MEKGIEGKVTMTSRGSVTIPSDIRKAIGCRPGTEFRVTAEPDTGMMIFYTQVSVDRDQAWFWTPEWLRLEAEVDKDFAEGRYKEKSSKEFKKEIESW